jgi:hypothetical protein
MIRWLVASLLIANVLFGALVGFGEPERSPDAQILDLQMNADKVRVVGGGQDKPALPTGGALSSACLAWGPFSAADASRARELLAGLVPAETVYSRELVVPGGGIQWLVREPGEAVMAKVLELKQANFPDSALGAIECPR